MATRDPKHAPETEYRLAPVPDQHRERSTRLILQAARAVAPRSAIILGAGRCEEIPLPALAEQFESLVINDIDSALLETGLAAADLPVEDRQKINLQTLDLTGISEAVAQECRQIVQQTGDVDEAITRVSKVVAVAQPILPALPRFDLVVASCVLSQLTFGLIQSVRGQLAERFVGSEQRLQNDPRLTGALDALTRRCESAFVELLTSLIAPGGRIFFSDTIQMCFVRLSDQGNWITPGTWRMTKSLRLDDYLDRRFDVVARERWNWVVDPPASVGEQGRLYDVQAMVLGLMNAPPTPT